MGLLSARELMAEPEGTWGYLRDAINDRRVTERGRYLARCFSCDGGVYIRSQAVNGDRLPMFVHFKGEGLGCQWHHAPPMKLDDARAAQYRGKQESALHWKLCNLLAELLKADPRAREITVGTYHAPTQSEHGRYPDVHAILEGLPPVTLELQLSKAFAPEIAARGSYYGREGIGLIWVFYGLDIVSEELPQSFRDIIRRHRGNAFLFDQRAMQASREAQTLSLWCVLRKADGGFYKPKLITLDHLTFPTKGLPYLEDRRTPVLVQSAKDARTRWFAAMKTIDHQRGLDGYSAPEFTTAWGSLRANVPTIAEFKRQLWDKRRLPKGHILALLAVLFSIARTAKDGRDRNLATAQVGMVNMLNTRLNVEEYAQYATLIEAMLKGTAACRLLTANSLRQKIASAKAAPQVLPGHPLWEAAAWLFPEILKPLVRDELEYIGELPDWAIPR